MEELAMPGWDLAQLPDDPNLISQTWLEHYANGDPRARANPVFGRPGADAPRFVEESLS